MPSDGTTSESRSVLDYVLTIAVLVFSLALMISIVLLVLEDTRSPLELGEGNTYAAEYIWATLWLIIVVQSWIVIVRNALKKSHLVLLDYPYYSVAAAALFFGLLTFQKTLHFQDAQEELHALGVEAHRLMLACGAEYDALPLSERWVTNVVESDYYVRVCEAAGYEAAAIDNMLEVCPELRDRSRQAISIALWAAQGWACLSNHYTRDYREFVLIQNRYNIGSEHPFIQDHSRDLILAVLVGYTDPALVNLVQNSHFGPELKAIQTAPLPLEHRRERLNDGIGAVASRMRAVADSLEGSRSPARYPDWFAKLIHSWPLLLGLAIALKLGKTTGELVLLRRSARTRRNMGRPNGPREPTT